MNHSAGDATAPAPRAQIGFIAATALVVGNIIGAAIFMLPASLAPFGWNAVIGWIISLTGALCLAWVFARLAAKFPHAGGAHAFMEMGVGENAAFMGSWGYLMSVWSANAAILFTGVSYLSRLAPGLQRIPGGEMAVSLAVLIVLAWANARALGAGIQVVSSVIKLLPFTAILALAAYTLATKGLSSLAPVSAVPITFSATIATVGISFYAMLGLESAAVPSGTVKDPERTVPRATMVGTTLSGLVTAFSACAVALMLPLDVVSVSKAPASDFIGGYWGNWAGLFVAFCAVVSALGCLNGWLLVGAELPAAMSERGALPPWFGVRNRHGVPQRSLLVGTGVSGLFIVLASSKVGVGAFNFVALIATATNLVMYLFCAIAAFRFMRDGRMPRTFGLRVASIGAMIFALWAFYGSGWEALGWGAVLIAAGWPLHRLSQRAARRAADDVALAARAVASAAARTRAATIDS